MTIGEKIKYLRLKNNLTQEELAVFAKTKKQTIHKYENGIITNIPASKVKLIADRLNTTPSYLMGWITEESSAKNNIIANAVTKLRGNEIFYSIVEKLNAMDDKQLETINQMLSAFEIKKEG